MNDGVRVVVAEGPSARKGLLGFVLEGEGYHVVGEAATSAELARAVTTLRPDVVVVDDGVGAMAVGMVRGIAPSTRVILVWPGDVVPIGGDARLEPSDVLRELGRTMERLTGQPRTTTVGGTVVPEPAPPARQDPAALRAALARGDAAQLRRGSPSDAGSLGAVAGTVVDDRGPAHVVVLPVAPSLAGIERAEETTALGVADEVVLVPEAEDEGPSIIGPVEPGTRASTPRVPRRHAHKR